MDYTLFSNLLCPVIVIDQDGNILYANEVCELAFGLSQRQLERAKWPEFLNSPDEIHDDLASLGLRTLYREIDFRVGNRRGSVMYSIQVVTDSSKARKFIVSFMDTTTEKGLTTKLAREYESSRLLSRTAMTQKAELILTQHNLEQKVSQSSFLLDFYSKTRFTLDADTVAECFLKLACDELGFCFGIYLPFHVQSGKYRLAAGYRNQLMVSEALDLSSPDLTAKMESAPRPKPGVTVLKHDELRQSWAKRLYKHFGVTVENVTTINLEKKGNPVGQFQLFNFFLGDAPDENTLELLQYMSSPLELTFENAELYRSSVTDELTKINNVKYFRLRLQSEMARADRDSQNLSLLMLDIDHFKQINDTYGHQMGDLALQTFASVVKSALRTSDILARYGGEEFVIILPGTEAEAACIVAEKIRRKVSEIRIPGPSGAEIKFTVSGGIASFPHHGRAMEGLIDRADQALYVAKRSGRDRTEVFQTSIAA